jgi:hypothetical protein
MMKMVKKKKIRELKLSLRGFMMVEDILAMLSHYPGFIDDVIADGYPKLFCDPDING